MDEQTDTNEEILFSEHAFDDSLDFEADLENLPL